MPRKRKVALDEHIRKIDALDCSDRTKRRRKQQTSRDTFKAGDVSLRQNLNLWSRECHVGALVLTMLIRLVFRRCRSLRQKFQNGAAAPRWYLDNERVERSCLFHRDHRLTTNNVHQLSVALANMRCHNVGSQDDSLCVSGRLVLQDLKTAPAKIRFVSLCWNSVLLCTKCNHCSSALYSKAFSNLPEAPGSSATKVKSCL